MNAALEESRYWYGGPAVLPSGGVPDIWTEADFRNAINRLYLTVLLQSGEAVDAIDLARACRSANLVSGTLNATYWQSMIGADATLAEALLDGSLNDGAAEWVERITKRFVQARAGVRVAGMQFDSTVRQLGFMARFLEARAQGVHSKSPIDASFLAMADALRQLSTRLAPASAVDDNDAPVTTAPTTDAPAKASSTAHRETKKSAATRTPTQQTPAKKSIAKRTTARKSTTRKSTAKKTPAKKTATKKRPAAKKTPTRSKTGVSRGSGTKARDGQ